MSIIESLGLSDPEKKNDRLVERTMMLNTEINGLEERKKVAEDSAKQAEKDAGTKMIQLDSDLSIKESQVAAVASRITELTNLQEAKQKSCNDLQEKLTDLGLEVDKKYSQIAELEKDIISKNQDISVRMDNVAAMERKIEEDKQVNLEAKKMLSEKEDYISGKKSDLEAVENALDYRESNIAGKEKINSDKALELEKLAGVATAKDKDLAEREQKVVDGKIELDELVRVNTEVREKLWKDLEKYQVSLDEMNTVQEKIIADSKDLASRERDYQAKLADIQVREQVVKTKEKSLQITP